MNAEEIKKIAAVMEEFELTEFKLESDDMKMAIKREKPAPVAAMAAPMPTAPAPTSMIQAVPTADAQPQAVTEEPDAGPRDTIDSPIVGTFYIAPAPDADPFVKVGDEVDPDTVVCIVEAMKVMNEIKAEKSGVVKKVLVENAAPVEFGQPLFELG